MATHTNQTLDGRSARTTVEFPRYIDHKVLAAGVAESFTAPTNAKTVLLSGTGGFYARLTSAAAAPVGDVSDGTGSLYIGGSAWFSVPRDSAGACVISVLSVAGGNVSAAWYG